jgi:hypothetical protein
MVTIVDPTNENVAIVDGEIGHALRVAKVADPTRPTVAELAGGKIIGYGNFTS